MGRIFCVGGWRVEGVPVGIFSDEVSIVPSAAEAPPLQGKDLVRKGRQESGVEMGRSASADFLG